MNRRAIVGPLLCCLLSFGQLGLAEEGGDSRARLEEIETRVAAAATQLERITAQARELQSGLKQAESDLAALRTRERNSGDELRRVLGERDELVTELARLRQEFTRMWETSSARIRALYMGRHREGLAWQLTLGSQQRSLQKIAFYTDLVQEHDKVVLTRLTHSGKRIRDKKRSLDELVESRDKIKSELSEQRKQIARRVEQQRQVIAELQATEEKQKVALTALRAQALRLETVVSSITTGPGPDFYGSLGKRAAPVAPRAFEGQGLLRLKGKLPLPVSNATISKQYGRQKIEGFSDYVLSKGIEFELAQPASVAAVADGRVLYAGRMPGYGTILILDHGQRMYSLYGQLGEVAVRKGEVVDAGQKLASSSESSAGKGQLYFEIRKNGKPVDPAPYLIK